MTFPDDFMWGASTAAFQIEGAAYEDGKGPSVWDVFCERGDRVFEGHTGNIACDHYHRWQEDVNLMKEIGLQSYRFSVSWPRVMPDGKGAVNQAGLDFYDRLLDGLCDAGVKPLCTLFHWDYPQALFQQGGWLNDESSNWFADYAALLAEKFGDRVHAWMTFNEPQLFIGSGHKAGAFAPGLRLSMRELLVTAHNVLLSHGKAVQAIRSRCSDTQIGWAPVFHAIQPESESAEDIQKARDFTFSTWRDDLGDNSWWCDPVYHGHYPEDGLKRWENILPPIKDGDMEIIHQPLDFFAFNQYASALYADSAHGEPTDRGVRGVGRPRTAFGWDITPQAFYHSLKWISDYCDLPILVTENGCSNVDWVSLDGAVHDPQRIDLLHRYLQATHEAISEGVPVIGYCQWSLFDNFEWLAGYSQRFGLIHVDYETQKRTLKDSALWYKNVIATNGGELIP